MLNDFYITADEYKSKKPYPYLFQDNILNESFAKNLQNEILNIPHSEFDKYDNPFEKKITLRNKKNYTPLLKNLIEYLESVEYVKKLSDFTGYDLIVDENRNFNGVHIYENGDKLDIHLDAEMHPNTRDFKTITLGIYLSYNWNPEYNCNLEIWDGSSGRENNPELYKCVEKICPVFNRLILFTNSDISWHGNPDQVDCSNDAKRLFVTISYLSKNINNETLRQKALFIKRPFDKYDEEKDRLRKLRADPIHYKEVYRTNKF